MPIAPEYLYLYKGPVWEARRQRVLKRAYYQCTRCRRPLHKWIFTYTWHDDYLIENRKVRIYSMIWIREGAKTWRNQDGAPCSPRIARGLPRKIRVKLTVAHYDHTPENMDDSNLRCFCTWCHLHHDMPHHKYTRSGHKDQRRPILVILEEGYGTKEEGRDAGEGGEIRPQRISAVSGLRVYGDRTVQSAVCLGVEEGGYL